MAHMVYAGRNQEMSFAYYEVPAYVYMTTMCIVDVFYTASVLAGEYLGKKKRLQERSVLNLDEIV